MEYFSLLHLQKEPFSNSPDPEMFFQSAQHQGCLQKLELAIRLKRGLCVVIGDIGTGKSTLCRQLIRLIGKDNHQILPHLVLDPEFTTPREFLATIITTFGLPCPEAPESEWQLKDTIKNYLFEQAIEHRKLPVLIIDEGQKLPGFAVELLREFLNFETNQHKLLQIVIFAQEEFREVLRQKPNFADRITTYQRLRPLSLRDTRAMIAFRLKQAHTAPGPAPRLFSPAAILAIYCLTGGYPRRIVMLCSQVIIAILITHQQQAGVLQVLRATRETTASPRGRLIRPGRVALMTSLVAAVAGAVLLSPLVTPRPQPVVIPKATPLAAPKAEELPPSPPARPAALPQPKPPVAPPAPEPSLAATPTAPILATPPPGPAAPQKESVLQSRPAAGQTTPRPTTLGSLEVDPLATLSKMVARIYGRYSPKKLAKVLQANPQITDPNHVAPGTLISFPCLQQNEPPALGQAWLELARTTDLAGAYAVVREYPETAPPLAIKPIMAAGSDSQFRVVLEESFADEGAARAKVGSLPPSWQERAKPIPSQ